MTKNAFCLYLQEHNPKYKMQNSKLWLVFSSLEKSELSQVKKYLQSPFLNQREDLPIFLEFLCRCEEIPPTSQEVWQAVCPGLSYSSPNFNRLCSRLLKQIESFLSLTATPKPQSSPLKLTNAYRAKRLDQLAGSALQNAKKRHQKAPIQDAHWHLNHFLIAEKIYSLGISSQQRTGQTTNLLEASEALDNWFIIEKLKLACSLLASQQLTNSETQLEFLEEIFHKMEKRPQLPPTLSLYWHAFLLLTPPQQQDQFRAFRRELKAHAQLFAPDEQRSLFLIAINFCIRQINQGESEFLPIMYSFYQKGLEEKWLFDRGELSAWTFKNIVSSGLKMRDFEGVEGFLNTYQNRLPEAIRTSFYRYNLAELQLARGEYQEALRTLRFFHFKDALTDLRARLVQIKAGYELGDVQLVDYQISNLRQLIQRRKELAYHRENYRNFARLVKRLINLPPGDWPARNRLQKAISKSPALVEQGWLLEQLKKRE